MVILELIEQNIEKVIQWILVPIVLVGALISVITSDIHKDFYKDKYNLFEDNLNDKSLGAFLDRCYEYSISLIYGIFIVGFIFFIGILIIHFIDTIIKKLITIG